MQIPKYISLFGLGFPVFFYPFIGCVFGCHFLLRGTNRDWRARFNVGGPLVAFSFSPVSASPRRPFSPPRAFDGIAHRPSPLDLFAGAASALLGKDQKPVFASGFPWAAFFSFRSRVFSGRGVFFLSASAVFLAVCSVVGLMFLLPVLFLCVCSLLLFPLLCYPSLLFQLGCG